MNLLEQIEMCVFIAAALFGAAQVGMILAARFWKQKVTQWKAALMASRSMWAKLELIIFF